MIKEFVDIWDRRKNEIEEVFKTKHPSGYDGIVKQVITLLGSDESLEYGDKPDPKRIHIIDDGDYQGTLLFVVGANNYQPCVYWYVFVSYGSCSGCDTFQAIRDNDYGDIPNEQQVKDYMTLALHVVQGLKKITN